MSKRKRKNNVRFQPHTAPMNEPASLPFPASGAVATTDDGVATMTSEDATRSDPQASDVLREAKVSAAAAYSEPLAQDAARAGPDESLGQRLRAVREARGMSREAAAHAMKLPASVLAALEADQFDRIGHGIYLRGYLNKYLQLLDLPQVLADRVLRNHQEPPPLTTSAGMSHSRYLFERYSGSALYLILTAVIVVPAVLLALRMGWDRRQAHITPLDVPAALLTVPATQTSAPQAVTVANPASAPESQPIAKGDGESPYIASMAPFPAAAEAPTEDVPSSSAAGHRLRLTLREDSWVEVRDASGKQLEFSLLPAGSVRDYPNDQALDVRIGNANGAVLAADGKPLDLAAFRRANVAHLKVVAGTAAPARSND